MSEGADIRVALADDNYLAREALTHLLTDASGIQVVASCASEASLLQAVHDFNPDVVVTDIRMPPTHTDEGLRIAASLRESHPEMGVVVLSQFADPRYSLALLDHGSDRRAYLLKERVQNRGQLTAAIEAVAQGNSMIDAKIVEGLIAERRRAERSPLLGLTPRELEILSYVAHGDDNQSIADQLFLTKRAVEKHIHAIFLKLGLAHSTDISPRVKATLIYLAENEES